VELGPNQRRLSAGSSLWRCTVYTAHGGGGGCTLGVNSRHSRSASITDVTWGGGGAGGGSGSEAVGRLAGGVAFGAGDEVQDFLSICHFKLIGLIGQRAVSERVNIL
jgi:hypothetical protein